MELIFGLENIEENALLQTVYMEMMWQFYAATFYIQEVILL